MDNLLNKTPVRTINDTEIVSVITPMYSRHFWGEKLDIKLESVNFNIAVNSTPIMNKYGIVTLVMSLNEKYKLVESTKECFNEKYTS